MKLLTIFTPTYNRAHILGKLYESLCNQTSTNFIWLVVDDGSEDNTSSLIKQWKEEGVIDINYFKQENGGKMRAHNNGVMNASTELFFCVDSDDYLTNNAVELIEKKWNHNIMHNPNICGIIAYKSIVRNGYNSIICPFPNLNECKLYELYSTGFKGDTSLVFKTEVLKQHPFPEIEGEKFITEAYVYEKIDQKYKYELLAKSLMVCEYREDGYTRNITKVHNDNPHGMALYFNQHAKYTLNGFIDRLRSVMYYIIYAKKASMDSIYEKSNYKGVIYLTALMLSVFYKDRV